MNPRLEVAGGFGNKLKWLRNAEVFHTPIHDL
jgi:hypothetical protein